METAYIDLLGRFLADPERPFGDTDAEALKNAVAKYPAAQIFRLMAAMQPQTEDPGRQSRERLWLAAPDPRTIAYANHGKQWAGFYPPEAKAPTMGTNEVIDTFLEKYGHSDPAQEALLERMIFNPTPDYGEILAREESENLPPEPEGNGSPDDLIASFILSHHPGSQTAQTPTEPEPDSPAVAPHAPADQMAENSLLSESLAAVFIRQGRYEKAYDIISSLNLKFPKKSAYFADQLRFLRKLMKNQALAKASGRK